MEELAIMRGGYQLRPVCSRPSGFGNGSVTEPLWGAELREIVNDGWCRSLDGGGVWGRSASIQLWFTMAMDTISLPEDGRQLVADWRACQQE